MDDALMSKVSALLSDPETVSKLASVAGVRPQKSEPSIKSDPHIALLSSVKPLLRQEKQHKIDGLVKALTLIELLNNGGL